MLDILAGSNPGGLWRSDGGDLSTFRSRTASLPHGGTERALTLQCAEGLQLLLLAPDTVRRPAWIIYRASSCLFRPI